MDVTVADLLALPELKECRLLDARVSCARIVKSVAIMDNPDILNWMSDYEILFSNGSSLSSLSGAEWKTFFEGLNAKRAAALFIKLQYYVDKIPEEAVSRAVDLDLPIVVVPNGYSWVKLSAPIQRRMIRGQFYAINESLDLSNALSKSMISEGSVGAVCRVAADRLSCGVAAFQGEGWALAGGTGQDDWGEVALALRAVDRVRFASPSRFSLNVRGRTVRVFRLPNRAGRYWGAYWDRDDARVHSDTDDLMIEQVNSALVLCLLKEEALRQVEQHYYLDFLRELLEGSLSDDDEIAVRSARLGRTIHSAYQIVATAAEGAADAWCESLVAALRQHPDPLLRDVMYCSTDAAVAFLCPVHSREDRVRIEALCAQAERCAGSGDLRFGVSGVHAVSSAHEAYFEALSAMTLFGFSARRVLYYDDLGLIRLLARDAQALDIPFVSDFYERILGSIVRHDRESKVSLVDTLDAYFHHEGSVGEASRALHIHENTLRMRLRSIERLSGCELRDCHDMVKLYLAVAIHRLMES